MSETADGLRMNQRSTHLYGFWFIAGDGRDWLAALELVDDKWTLTYRFRYHSPESTSPHDNKDRKSGYTCTGKDGSIAERDRILEVTMKVVALIELEFRSKVDAVILDCDPNDPKAFFELTSRPWAHVRVETLDKKTS